jgi:hypothetical protein
MSTATLPQAPAPRRRPASRPPVRAVPSQTSPPARAPFVGAVLVLLVLGLGALLLLNTLLAQGSFTLHTLDARVAELADREQALQQKVAELAAPQRLARRASAIGMVPSVNPAFLRASDGKVLGVPVPASAPAPVVVSEPAPAEQEEKKQQDQQKQQDDKKQNDQQTKQDQQKQQDDKKQGQQTKQDDTQGAGGAEQ